MSTQLLKNAKKLKKYVGLETPRYKIIGVTQKTDKNAKWVRNYFIVENKKTKEKRTSRPKDLIPSLEKALKDSKRKTVKHHLSLQDAARSVVNFQDGKYRFLALESRVPDGGIYKVRMVLREEIQTGNLKWVSFEYAKKYISDSKKENKI